jgi:imidazolonepropionase-like amidohydrolase
MTVHHLSADRIFDGSQFVANAPLHVADGIITAVGDGPPAPGAERHDFAGCTILPGLIDTHVHLVFSALDTHAAIVEQVGRETDDELLARALANARAALRAGVTTVRDCGGKADVVQRARDRIRRGTAEGADVLACGMPITTTGGHCHWLGLVADGEDAAVRAAERMLAADADFLKVMATGGNMTPSSDPFRAQYDAATLTRVVALGRSAQRHTAAHVLSRAGMPGAVAAGVRTIEHCDWRRGPPRAYEFDEELARRMIDQQQYAGLTMHGLTRRAFLPRARELYPEMMPHLDARFECERRMIEFGVPFTLHTDAGVRLTPIDTFALGLRAAALELRLTPREVLTAATRTPAEALGLTDRGTLAPGKRADLFVVEGNPMTDLACLQKVRAVMKAGKWVPSAGD